MTITVVIPTYWGRPQGHPPLPGDVAYDHPTPLDGQSTLPRLLDSLVKQDVREFNVLILTAAVSPHLEGNAESKVAELAAPYRTVLPIAQFAASDLRFLQERVQASGFDADLVSLRGYPNVRNIQLIIPHVLGSEVIIALDDDEIVAPDYVRQATTFVGSCWQGSSVSGVAGLYLDRAGAWTLPESEATGNVFLDKARIMNQAARQLMEQASQKALVQSPLAYGGNMVFHREMFARTGFDPWITRGEDIDYLLNARIEGYSFWFDPDLVVAHLPPDAYQSSPYAKLCEDVVRFVYERGKLKQECVDPSQLDPYPGAFLRDNLENHALAALEKLSTTGDEARLGPPREVLAQAGRRAREAPARYRAFARTWPHVMVALASDGRLRDTWRTKMASD